MLKIKLFKNDKRYVLMWFLTFFDNVSVKRQSSYQKKQKETRIRIIGYEF